MFLLRKKCPLDVIREVFKFLYSNYQLYNIEDIHKLNYISYTDRPNTYLINHALKKQKITEMRIFTEFKRWRQDYELEIFVRFLVKEKVVFEILITRSEYQRDWTTSYGIDQYLSFLMRTKKLILTVEKGSKTGIIRGKRWFSFEYPQEF